MPLSVPLSPFIRILKLAREFDARYQNFSQVAWMLDHWSFDDRSAYYQPSLRLERRRLIPDANNRSSDRSRGRRNFFSFPRALSIHGWLRRPSFLRRSGTDK